MQSMNESTDHSGWPTRPLYEYSWTRPVRIHRIARSYNNRCRDPRGELRGGGSSTACPIYASSNGVLFQTVPYHFVLFLLTVSSILALVFKRVSPGYSGVITGVYLSITLYFSQSRPWLNPRISSGVSIPKCSDGGKYLPG